MPVRNSALGFLSNQPVPGELLAERLLCGPMPPDEALRHAVAIGTALAQIHAGGAVHGGLSPHLIVIGSGGAAILQPAGGFDSRARPYRAPEQVLGRRPDERSDIFSFGAIVYEMAAGVRPFSGDGAELDSAILKRDPPPLAPSADPSFVALDALIAGCLAKDPAGRRQRMKNTVLELRLVGGGGQPAKGAAGRTPDPPHAAGPTAPDCAAEAMPQALAANSATQTAVTQRPGEPAPSSWNASRRPFGLQRSRRRAVLLRAGAAAVVLALLGLAYQATRRPEQVVKFTLPSESARFAGMPAVSPDGRYIAYFAVGPDSQRMLWLRSLDASHAKLVPHSEGAFAPFWSPASDAIGYFANRSLRIWKFQLSPGGEPTGDSRVLCPVQTDAGGGSWNRDGNILFSPGLADGLYLIPASGGTPRPVLQPDNSKSERSYRWPQFLPDRRHFLFFVATGNAERTGVHTGSLDPPAHKLLFRSETNAVFSAAPGALSRHSGYLLFMRSRASAGGGAFDLIGWPFNSSSMALDHQPMTLGSNIGAVEALSFAPISVSHNGVLVYQTVESAARQLVWVDRNGSPMGTLAEPAGWGPPKISRTGTSVIAGRSAGGGNPRPDLWLIRAGVDPVQITGGTPISSPVWSRDESRLAYIAMEPDSYDVYVQAASSNSHRELLLKSREEVHLTDWSPDGRYILLGQNGRETNWDIRALSVADRQSSPVVQTVRSEDYAAISPDSRWIAFQADYTGHYEVYVQPFNGIGAGAGRRRQVSAAGGGLPRWRSDGREIYFATITGSLMAATVRTAGTDVSFDAPHELFRYRLLPKMPWTFFDPSPDGRKFVMNLPLDWSNSSQIYVMTNWTEALK